MSNPDDSLSQQFLDAATSGDTAELQHLLQMGMDPDAVLAAAVRAKQAESVRVLLQRGADPNRLVDKWRTALHISAGTNCAETVRLLLRHGANPYWYYVWDYGCEYASALSLAWGKRDFDFLQAYIDVMPGGVDAVHPVSGSTLLHWAAGDDDKELVTFLLRQGASTDLANYHGFTPRDCLREYSRLLDLLPAHDNPRQPEALPLLHRLVKRGYLKMVDSMLAWGRPAPFVDIYAKGEDPDLVCQGGDTSLHLAAAADNVPMIELLLRYKAFINQTNDAGETPLYVAVKNDHPAAVRALLKAGANPELLAHEADETPLMACVRHSTTKTAQALLKGGACTGTTDSQGFTAADKARHNQNATMLKLLEKYSSKQNP